MRTPTLPLLAWAVLVVAACAEGQLSQSTFTEPCASSDPSCAAPAAAASAPVALGGRLALDVTPRLAGAASVALTLRPVDPDVLTIEDGVVVANAPGVSGVLLLGEDGVVVDVLHVTVQKAERLTLHRSLDGSAVVDERALPAVVQVFPGEEITLKLEARAGAQSLRGDLSEAWSSSNADFLLVDQGFSRERRVRCPTEGAADVDVTLSSGLRTSVRFEVVQ